MSYLPPLQPVPFALADRYVPPAPVLFELGGRAWDWPDPPRLRVSSRACWRIARAPVDAQIGTSWEPSQDRSSTLRIVHGQATARTAGIGTAWDATRPSESEAGDSWAHAVPIDASALAAVSQALACDRTHGSGWRIAGRALHADTTAPWRTATVRDRQQLLATRRSREHAGSRVAPLPAYVPFQPVAFGFSGESYSPAASGAVFFQLQGGGARERFTRPVDGHWRSAWGQARALQLRLGVAWGWSLPADPPPIGIEYPDYDGPVYVLDPAAEPDLKETYMIANSVSLVVLPGREPVDATGIKVARDIDAFAWTLSADLFGRTSLNLVRPDANGPRTVELTINGWTWLFLIERYSTQGKFPSERFSITGVSRTQLLAEPYAPKRSAVNAADINAVQAATDQLDNTGFTLSWDYTGLGPPDWTIPGGAFSYQQQTALQVIARVAEAVGGVVKPARDSDALAVVPRYRAAPWAWATEIMDRIIPAEIVGQWGGEWSPQPEWNSCYVSGTTHGVAVDVRRAGTAGDAPAPDVFDDLITGTDAARHRGIAEIAKGGNQEIVTLSLPLFPQGGSAPGLVDPAHLCEVRDIDGTWRGLCLSTEISAEGVGASRVTQTLKLERHH